MWLETPSPAPSPINVHVTVTMPPGTVNVPPDITLEHYTLALAIATGALAALTLGTLTFFGIQIISSLRAARPRLEPKSGGGNIFVWPRRGRVTYMNGSTPAFNVEVWVQSANEPNEYLTSPCSTLTPSRDTDEYDTDQVNQDQTMARWPFRETDPSSRSYVGRAQDEWFIGLTWSDPANRQYRVLWKTCSKSISSRKF